MYLPHILELQSEVNAPIRFADDGRIQIVRTMASLQMLFDLLPKEIKQGMKLSARQLSLDELQEDIHLQLGVKVYGSSLAAAVSSVYCGHASGLASFCWQKIA